MDQVIAGMTVPQAVDPALWRAFQNSSGLLALLPVGIYICDQTGKVVWSNEKAATLWGRIPKVGPGGRARGSVKVFLPNGDRITAQSGPMARVLATGKGMNEQEAALEQPDGLSPLAAPADPAERAGFFQTKADVFRDGEIGKQ